MGRHYWKYGPYPTTNIVQAMCPLALLAALLLPFLSVLTLYWSRWTVLFFWGFSTGPSFPALFCVFHSSQIFFPPPIPDEFFYRTENKSMNLCLQHRKRSIPHTRTSRILQFFYGSTVGFSNAPKFSNKINEISRRAEMCQIVAIARGDLVCHWIPLALRFSK